MNVPDLTSPVVPFKDRSAGLTVFGVLTILAGGLCALFVPLMLWGQAMSEKTTGMPANYQAIIPGTVLYGVLAVALVWLGIGSCKARRWARALLLIFSWSWLVMGVIALVFMILMLPQLSTAIQSSQPTGQPPLPEAAKTVMVVLPLVFMGVIFILIPAVWVFFYRSLHVKATCEARDPARRWTDACPLPVLAVSLWLALGVPMMLLMPLTYRSMLPFFGGFITGPAGTAGYIVLAGVWAWCARALYRLDVRGWWLLVAGMLVFTVSHVMTYMRHDVMELYALMGYPEQQMEQIRKFNFLTNGMMTWGSLCSMLPFFGYLVFLKRYFLKQ